MTPRAKENPSMPGMERQAFMQRIHAALGRDATQPPAQPVPRDEWLTRRVRAGQELIELFSNRATQAGMSVRRLRGSELLRQLTGLLKELGVKSLVAGVGSVPQALGLKESLRRQGMVVVDWAASPGLEAQFEVDAGITDVHAAIAETGTLVCAADAGHSRGLSLIPPIHIAVVRKSDLLPDLLDYTSRLGEGRMALPSSIALISGPSKTADIEGVLIVGVHGPGQVHVLLVEDA